MVNSLFCVVWSPASKSFVIAFIIISITRGNFLRLLVKSRRINTGLIIESNDYSLQHLLLVEFQNTFAQRFVHFCFILISAVRLPISLTSSTRHRALVPVLCVPLKIVFSSLLFDLSPFIILQFCAANYRNIAFIPLKAC